MDGKAINWITVLEEAVNWITALEDFHWNDMGEEQCVQFTKLKLKGQARKWQRSIDDNIVGLHQPLFYVEWDEKWLEEKYLQSNYEESLFMLTMFKGQFETL